MLCEPSNSQQSEQCSLSSYLLSLTSTHSTSDIDITWRVTVFRLRRHLFQTGSGWQPPHNHWQHQPQCRPSRSNIRPTTAAATVFSNWCMTRVIGLPSCFCLIPSLTTGTAEPHGFYRRPRGLVLSSLSTQITAFCGLILCCTGFWDELRTSIGLSTCSLDIFRYRPGIPSVFVKFLLISINFPSTHSVFTCNLNHAWISLKLSSTLFV